MGLPRYAVVKLKEGADTLELYGLLVRHGYLEVSFVERLSEAPQYNQVSSPRPTSESPSPKKRKPAQPTQIAQLYIKEEPNEVAVTSSASSTPDGFDEEYEPTDESITEKHPTLTSVLNTHDNSSPTSKSPSLGQLLSMLDRESGMANTSPQATATPIISSMLNHEGIPTEEQLILMKLNSVFENKGNHLLMESPSPSSTPTRSFRDTGKLQLSAGQMAYHPSEEEPVECRKCHVKLKVSRTHCIRYHLAMHWSEKQFRCSICQHSSHLNGNVKIHIKSNHPQGAEILDRITDSMVDGWCQLVGECFPQHAEKVIRLLRTRQKERLGTKGDIATIVPGNVGDIDSSRMSLPTSIAQMRYNSDAVANAAAQAAIVKNLMIR